MHLTDEQLNEYLDNESSGRSQIEAHLDSCDDCAVRYSTLKTLFTEIESLTELTLTHDFADRFTLRATPGRPAKLPRSLTLTVTVQAVFAVVLIIIAAPFVLQFVSPYLSSLPASFPSNIFLLLQAEGTIWLDTLSTLQVPALPEIPAMEISSLFMLFTIIGVSMLWLIGNGLLLRNQIK